MAKRKKNVEMGFWRNGIFHPIRASRDYDEEEFEPGYKSPSRKKNPLPVGKFTDGKVRRNSNGTFDVLIEKKRKAKAATPRKRKRPSTANPSKRKQKKTFESWAKRLGVSLPGAKKKKKANPGAKKAKPRKLKVGGKAWVEKMAEARKKAARKRKRAAAK